jgi:hypothetical protein
MLLFLSLLASTLWQQPELTKEIAGMWINQDPAAGGITRNARYHLRSGVTVRFSAAFDVLPQPLRI